MWKGAELTLLGAVICTCGQVVSGQTENAGLIAGVTVVGVLVLVFFVGMVVFCCYKNGAFSPKEEKKKSHKNKHNGKHSNGVYAPHKQDPRFVPPNYQPHPYHVNGVIAQPRHTKHAKHVPMEPMRIQPLMYPYNTYHGPPPQFQPHVQQHPGTFTGPPPIIIKAGTGTMTLRPDPRPVVHTTKKRDPTGSDSKHRSDRHRERPAQEFVVQQSHDGIPVIRPVIYIDDDKHKPRSKSRSKSRERKYKKKSDESSASGARITEIPLDTTPMRYSPEVVRAEINPVPSRSRSATPPPRPPAKSPEVRSRASSVTEAVNALRMSVRDHIGSDTDSFSSKAPSFNWAAQTDLNQAPEPKAGDVMFFPAGTENAAPARQEPRASTSREIYGYTKVIEKSDDPPAVIDGPRDQTRDEVYGYTSVIKSSIRRNQDEQTTFEKRESPTPVARSTTRQTEQGYEVPASLRQSAAGTREEDNKYETEHGRTTSAYHSNIGASMSDRLSALVEDGDKTRFTHYNLGAINLGTEDEEDTIDPVQLRVRRPRTPPVDIPRDSYYSQSSKRPNTPPNDIPLITPRESTEIPPLNLQSSYNTPRDLQRSYRPPSPPMDFPITPKSSIVRPRPSTPPFDADTHRSELTQASQSKVVETSNTNQVTARSDAVDPYSGEPGSFQARQRLIEAHLQKNSPGAPPTKPSGNTENKSSGVHFNKNTEFIPRSEPSSARELPAVPAGTIPVAPPAPPPPVVHVTPGVIPPAPPPPPPPPPPPAPFR